MAKRKEFEISGKINLTPNISEKDLKKLEKQIHGVVGTVNMEGIDRNHAQHQRELNNELRETLRLREAINRTATRQSRIRSASVGDYFPELAAEYPGNYGTSASTRRQLASTARGPQVPYNYVGALTSKSERDLRELHGSHRPIIYDEFLKSRGNVIDRSYIDKEGIQRVELLNKGRELYEFLVQENVKNSKDLNALAERIKADPPGRFKQEILPAIYNLLHMGVFSDTTFPSQLPRKYSGSNVPHSEMAEHIIRAITTSGLPLRMSNLTGGKTLEIGSYQRAMEYIKPLKVGGYLTQYQHDVDIHPLAALASPRTSFGWTKANSGVRPLTPLDNAYNFMSQMGYANKSGYELQHFDLKDIVAQQSYKLYSPKWKVESDKPPRAILPYGMSYVPLTTGFQHAIEGFGPGIFNEETTANLSGQINRFGGKNPSWDYLTSRWRQDFDFSKYLAYRSDYDVLLHSNPTTEVQAARKHENWLFNSNLYDDSSTGRQFEMRQRMDWYGNKDILSLMPDQQNSQIVLTGIFDTLRKHFSYADRYGVHNSYSGLSNSDLLQLIEMAVIVSRRATPTLFEEYDPSKPVPMNPMLGIHEFTSKAKTQDFLFLAELMQGVQLNALRDELYRFATIADKNASIQNLTLESLSDINRA
ncbi:MAG: hypothetical protein M0P69_21260, partial [Bacteroidales bacterium]|nr:hypothetical protein [Bacteroidales bacterium]